MSSLQNYSEEEIEKIKTIIKTGEIKEENSELIARIIGSTKEKVIIIMQRKEETHIKGIIGLIKNTYGDSLYTQMLALDQEIEDGKRIIKEKIHKHDQIENELFNLGLT